MRRFSLLTFLAALLLFSGCDAADPIGPDPDPDPDPTDPTVLELLTAHRWYNHGHTLIDPDTGEDRDPDKVVLPNWYEFDEDGTLRGELLGQIDEVGYVLAEDGSYFLSEGYTFYIEELTEDTLRFYYEAWDYGITVTCHPTEPED